MNKRVDNTISVIIPVWNRAVMIQRALMSVITQTHPPKEIIIVDDGSSDDTVQNIQTIIAHYPIIPITLCCIEHCGMAGKVRNIGIAQAKGDWIALLDSDDVWEPNKLEKQTQHIINNNVRWCHTRERWMNKGKEVSQKKQNHRRAGNIFDDALQKCIVGPSTVIIHKSVFEMVGLFREDVEIAEDYELWLRIAYKYEIGYIDEKLVIKYAGHGNQLSEKYGYIEKFRIDILQQFKTQNTFDTNTMQKIQTALEKKTYIWNQGRSKRVEKNSNSSH